jgi:hypothetical protein
VSGVGGKICTDADSIAVTSNKNESQVIFKVDRTHETTVVQDLRAEKCVCGETDVSELRQQLDDVTRKLDWTHCLRKRRVDLKVWFVKKVLK